MKETQGFFQRVAQRYVGGFSLINFSIYPLGNTPSAPSEDKFFHRVNRQRADIDALKEWMERSELRAKALELENESLSARLDSMVDKLCFCTRAEVTSQVVGSEISNGRNSDVILPRSIEPNPSLSTLMNLRIIHRTLEHMLS